MATRKQAGREVRPLLCSTACDCLCTAVRTDLSQGQSLLRCTAVMDDSDPKGSQVRDQLMRSLSQTDDDDGERWTAAATPAAGILSAPSRL